MSSRPYHSNGEGLGLQLEEFDDVTISKIRFLESQGLIEPERTTSGYRKFFDADVERLRFILREQKDNFLPLKIIKDRLEFDATPPAGAVQVPEGAPPPDVTRNHPSTGHGASRPVPAPPSDSPDPSGRIPAPAVPDNVSSAHDLTDVALTRAELLVAAGADEELLVQLESFGLIAATKRGADEPAFDGLALRVVQIARSFAEVGIDARHLKGWRTSAEREGSLFEQRILPLLRQRNPQARETSVELMRQLVRLGGELRSVMMDQALRQYLGGR